MCEHCNTFEKDGMPYRGEGVTICPKTCHQGDSVGFTETIDTDNDEEVEKACKRLEFYLKAI